MFLNHLNDVNDWEHVTSFGILFYLRNIGNRVLHMCVQHGGQETCEQEQMDICAAYLCKMLSQCCYDSGNSTIP